jgi:hypothetical protein
MEILSNWMAARLGSFDAGRPRIGWISPLGSKTPGDPVPGRWEPSEIASIVRYTCLEVNGSPMQKKNKSRLALALRKKLLVRFESAWERGTVNGYVLDIGPQFFLIALVSDGIRLNGFQCFRLSDVRKLQVPDKYARFHEAALKKRRQRFPKKPPIDITSLAQLLLTANNAFPLVTIHREKIRADSCWIGRVVDVRDGRVTLLEIGPGAVWDSELETYRLSEITRIDFGGDYEDALYLVGASQFKRAVRTIWGNSRR